MFFRSIFFPSDASSFFFHKIVTEAGLQACSTTLRVEKDQLKPSFQINDSFMIKLPPNSANLHVMNWTGVREVSKHSCEPAMKTLTIYSTVLVGPQWYTLSLTSMRPFWKESEILKDQSNHSSLFLLCSLSEAEAHTFHFSEDREHEFKSKT
jgi:hypothetical protein